MAFWLRQEPLEGGGKCPPRFKNTSSWIKGKSSLEQMQNSLGVLLASHHLEGVEREGQSAPTLKALKIEKLSSC